MKNSSKAGILIIGIFIGIIAGVALASFMDYKGWEINPLHQFSNFDFFGLRTVKTPANPTFRMSDPDERDTQTATAANQNDTTAQNESLLLAKGLASTDTSKTNASSYNQAPKVSTDQLLFSRQVKIGGYSENSNKRLDSLLIDDKYSETNKGLLKVEFWQSPINYSGYKWANNKLILFGFYDFESVKISFVDGEYFLHYGTLYYLLESTNTFRNMTLIQDEAMIKKLNDL